MPKISNKASLIENGETEPLQTARALALTSLEHALDAADPKKLLHDKLSLEDSFLRVDDLAFDLSKFTHVYVLGGGKASGAMSEALEEVLDNHITAGLVNVPYGTKKTTQIVKLHEASHPVPDEKGVEGTCRMMQMAEQADESDLVICLFSGGGSSLMPMPREGLSLEDKREITNLLLNSGAAINEVNAVRKHLSAFKGGWLAKKAYPATVLNLVLSDVVGDPLDAIASGPTVPDPSTFADARRVLEKYGLWETAPASVRKVLSDGANGAIEETPKSGDAVFKKVHSLVVGNNRVASLAALERLKSEGLNTVLLTATLEGEAAQVGKVLASVAREVTVSGNPVPRPAGIVVGGETTVTVTGKGIGGRNQELTLSAALMLKDIKDCVVASLSTDGVDGPTDAAGAIADTCTLQCAERLELMPELFLEDNDSYSFFSKLGDLIQTGQTGTNVNDITVIVLL
jgi:glycerate 2-kinase